MNLPLKIAVLLFLIINASLIVEAQSKKKVIENLVVLKNQSPKKSFFIDSLLENKVAIKKHDYFVHDLEFTKNWNYPTYTYRNMWGQLSCDGWCPPEVEKMKGDSGKIKDEYLQEIYNYIDTTHHYHTFNSTTDIYEFGESRYFTFRKLNDSTYFGSSSVNVSTHSSLVILMQGDSVSAWIEYNSITSISGNHYFKSLAGSFEMDSVDFGKGLLTAHFSFIFNDPFRNKGTRYWYGVICTPIIVKSDKKVIKTD